MTDIYNKEKRSEVMSRIRSSGNKTTELRLIEFFNRMNITGWRRGYKVIGHPDFVFIDKKIAVFVDGCFWHGHDCRNTQPKQNAEFWEKKIERSKHHDEAINERFIQRGWIVVRIWECELKKKKAEQLHEKLKKVGLV